MPHKQILKVYEESLRKGTLERLRISILEVVEKTLKDCQTENSFSFNYLGTRIDAQEMDLKKFIFNVSSYITLS